MLRRIWQPTALLLLASLGCSPAATPTAAKLPTEGATVLPREVSAESFAGLAYQLLLDGSNSPQRTELLKQVVRFQLSKARLAFSQKKSEQGVRRIEGALQLVRRGEFNLNMIDGHEASLLAAAETKAHSGQAGDALAFYSMLDEILPKGAPQKRDLDGHLRALHAWTAPEVEKGTVSAARAAQIHEVRAELALRYPTEANFQAAVNATLEWVAMGIKTDLTEAGSREFDRDEALEAYRGVKTGGVALTALFLRDGNAKGALEFIQQNQLAQLLSPTFIERLEQAGVGDNPEAWELLYQSFARARVTERPELALSEALANAATWGAALELHRATPGSFPAAMPLCDELLQHGFAELVPLVTSDTLTEDASPQEVSTALSFVWRALAQTSETDSQEATRRVFAASNRVLQIAESLEGRVRPPASSIHFLMGSLEKRWGDLERARAHFETAVKLEPAIATLTAIADIDRQRGEKQTALRALAQARSAAEKAGDSIALTELRLREFEIYRDQANLTEAENALSTGLTSALTGVATASSDTERVRSEVLLARILEHYGDQAGAQRALERAWEAAQSRVENMGAVLLESARRALTERDLPAMRQAARRAVQSRLPDDELVYIALWLKLLERDLGVQSEGTAREALALLEDEGSSWTARLGAWGRGEMPMEALQRAAEGPIEQTEALFYLALWEKPSSDAAATLGRLKQVAESVALELVEVTVARDWVARASGAKFMLPASAQVP